MEKHNTRNKCSQIIILGKDHSLKARRYVLKEIGQKWVLKSLTKDLVTGFCRGSHEPSSSMTYGPDYSSVQIQLLYDSNFHLICNVCAAITYNCFHVSMPFGSIIVKMCVCVGRKGIQRSGGIVHIILWLIRRRGELSALPSRHSTPEERTLGMHREQNVWAPPPVRVFEEKTS